MAQSKPLNGEEIPRRKITTYQEYLAQKNITDDLPPSERIKKIADLCRVFEMGAKHLSDNLQPGEIERRIGRCEGVTSDLQEMIMFCTEDEHVVGLIESCVRDMGRFEECKMNGASVEFQACANILLEQKQRLETGKIALAGLLHPAAANDSHALEASLHI